ncbi:MAG: diguanylate cyclase [Gemmatimonadota bacterium]
MSESQSARLILLGEPSARPQGLERTLVRAGYVLLNPAAAEPVLETQLPDLIMISHPAADWALTALLEQLGSRSDWRGIPRLVLLSDPAPSAVAAALKAGADDAVGPAAPQEEIVARIAAALRRRTAGEPTVGFVATELYSDRHAQSRFFTRLASEVSRATRYSLSLVLIRAAVAEFEERTARLGDAEAGRQADEVAVILRSVLRVPDFSVRIGAAEFAIALPETESEGAAAFLARWRQALDLRLAGHLDRFTIVAGISALPQPVMPDAGELHRMAEEELTRARAVGR